MGVRRGDVRLVVDGLPVRRSDDIPPPQYVIRDAAGRVLAGGDVELGLMWRAQGMGDPVEIVAGEFAYQKLWAENMHRLSPGDRYGNRYIQ